MSEQASTLTIKRTRESSIPGHVRIVVRAVGTQDQLHHLQGLALVGHVVPGARPGVFEARLTDQVEALDRTDDVLLAQLEAGLARGCEVIADLREIEARGDA